MPAPPPPLSATSSIPIGIAAGSVQPPPPSPSPSHSHSHSHSHSRISTSVQMSDGTCLPFSFRHSAFHRSSPSPHLPENFHGTQPSSVRMASPPRASTGPRPLAAFSNSNSPFSFSLEAGFSLSPTVGFHPASFTGPGSLGAAHLARMETAFCQNFVCCALPLRDLHDLLDHFEQAHCHAGDIVGVDGFEGVTLDQMAAGVGLSAELGLGPGTLPSTTSAHPADPSHRRRRRAASRAPAPPPALHELRFEDEEEWSSGRDTSRSVSPAHINGANSPSHTPALGFDSVIEDNTMNRLGKTLRETLGTLSPADRPRPSSSSRSRSGSLSASQEKQAGAGTHQDLSELFASFRSMSRANRTLDQLASSGFLRGELAGACSEPNGSSPIELEDEPIEGGAIDPAVLFEGSYFDETAGSDEAFGQLQLDPQQLIQHHHHQQRRRRPPNVDPITGLTPTGRLPRPWTPASEKPFKCTIPGCEKAYKQQNGLKYHKTHAHSSQAILTAEEESKAFVCHDNVCGKRYKKSVVSYHHSPRPVYSS